MSERSEDNRSSVRYAIELRFHAIGAQRTDERNFSLALETPHIRGTMARANRGIDDWI